MIQFRSSSNVIKIHDTPFDEAIFAEVLAYRTIFR